MSEEKVILVTNDDSYTSPGIKALVEVASEFGRPVVVAPDKPQSGMGHAITLNHPLRLTPVTLFKDIEAYKCSGTPVDCVKLAVDKVLNGQPDLCVSGINHGSNASINVIYSGTMSAAMEAALEGINSVGFSSLNYSYKADMSTCQEVARQIIRNVLENGMPNSKLLNVNIPNVTLDQLQGIKICRQAIGTWKEEFVKRVDPFKKNYYWMTGNFVCDDKGTDTDIWALNHNYVSVVPVQYDLTEYSGLSFLNEKWEFNAKT